MLMKQRVGHHHASDVNAVKQVFMKWDTKSFIEYFYFLFCSNEYKYKKKIKQLIFGQNH